MTELVPSIHATRGTPRVALITCAELPDLDPDDRLVLAPLAALGIAAEPAVWTDPAPDWTGYDLAVLRSSWDYVDRYDEFLAWTRRVPRLANTARVVAWNTDKRYLAVLAAAGVPVVPTHWLPPGAGPLPDAGEYVIKPVVSVGGRDTGRFDLADGEHRRLAAELAARLHAVGRTAMLQPYLAAVDRSGETALHYLGGRFSHAVRKGPLLTGPDADVPGLFRPEEISPRQPSPAELAVGERALAAVPGGPAALLYARVDLVPDPDGAPVVLELELTEPSLYLGMADGAAQRFAAAIAARLACPAVR